MIHGAVWIFTDDFQDEAGSLKKSAQHGGALLLSCGLEAVLMWLPGHPFSMFCTLQKRTVVAK